MHDAGELKKIQEEIIQLGKEMLNTWRGFMKQADGRVNI
jgi:hypothetical protein